MLPLFFSTNFDENKLFSISVERYENGQVQIIINLRSADTTTLKKYVYDFDAFPHLVAYLRGIWLEEHTFNELKTLQDEGVIYDLRMGVELTLNANRGTINGASQEFDILFTDGNALYVVECKSGYILAEHLPKLTENARKYGGIKAKPIYVTTRHLMSKTPANHALIAKIMSSPIIWNHEHCYIADAKKGIYRFSHNDFKSKEANLFDWLRERIRSESSRCK